MISPEKCPRCEMKFVYAEGESFAIYGCGSRHTARDNMKHSLACDMITKQSLHIEQLQMQLHVLSEADEQITQLMKK